MNFGRPLRLGEGSGGWGRLKLALTLGIALLLASPGFTQFQPQPQAPPEPVKERGDPSVRLPMAEAHKPIDGGRLAVVRGPRLNWQLICNATVLRDFAQDLPTATDTCRAMRDLKATEWVTLGSPAPVLEYGLTQGRAAVGVPRPRLWVALDDSTRVEQLRGVWVLRTETAIVANFGGDRASAEQSLAVVKRYGFNRAGVIGPDGRSAFLYYSAIPGAEPLAPNRNLALAVAALGETLTRTGVRVPGTDDYVGERVVIDPRAVEVKRDGSKFDLAHGADVLARFGNDEWSARDALNAVRDGQFTEVCRVAGATFYLANGQPPHNVGLGVRRTHFDPKGLKVRQYGDQFALVDPSGVRVASAPTRADAELLSSVVAGYEFDTVCECGGGRRGGMVYWAKLGR